MPRTPDEPPGVESVKAKASDYHGNCGLTRSPIRLDLPLL